MFTNSSSAPSFLSRLQGSTTASPYGIESVVNVQKLSNQGITAEQKSTIDYIYLSSSNPLPKCTIPGMPSWFYLDQNNLNTYQATAIAQCS